MIRLVAVAAAAVLGACATSATGQGNAVPARLVDASDPALREALRVHVRERIGERYMIDPDELLEGSVLTARKRRTPMPGPRAVLEDPPAEVLFRLVATTDKDMLRCHLEEDASSVVLTLPEATPCERLR